MLVQCGEAFSKLRSMADSLSPQSLVSSICNDYG